jgi:hypothetical protein
VTRQVTRQVFETGISRRDREETGNGERNHIE